MNDKQPIILKHGTTEITLMEEELSYEEQLLLQKLLSPPSSDVPAGHMDRLLHELLLMNGKVSPEEWSRYLTFPVRAVYIFLPHPLEDREDFSEAVQAFFSGSTKLFWKNSREGLFFQRMDDISDMDEDASIIDTLAADFFIRPAFYIGSIIHHPEQLNAQIEWESSLFREVTASLPEKHFFKEQELTLYYLLNHLSKERLHTVSQILTSVKDDPALLQSVHCFLECGMNISSAAKQMYMHRNTMQYRVDKFIEKTGIDIRRFPNAAAVYMLLLADPSAHND
jgi:DNA-binding PucR family transcriptional regulator